MDGPTRASVHTRKRERGNMRTFRVILLLLACAFATGAAAEYPDKPIRLVFLIFLPVASMTLTL